MKHTFLLLLFILPFVSFGQVGIGTSTPSDASMLEISGSLDGTNYKGLIPPRVPDQTAKSSMTPSSSDIGLVVFVLDTGTLEMWNGSAWENFYTLANPILTTAAQDFDTNTSWTYTTSPTFYQVADDIWDIIQTFNSPTIDANIDNVDLNFLGCQDLENGNGGTVNPHAIIFDTVNVSTLTNGQIAFDYDVFGFDAGDDACYTAFFDGVAQSGSPVLFAIGANGGGTTVEGTITINIPPGTTNVALTLAIKQDGAADYAGFDNFRVYGQ